MSVCDDEVKIELRLVLHIFQNAQVARNKMAREKRHHFIAQFSIPSHLAFHLIQSHFTQKARTVTSSLLEIPHLTRPFVRGLRKKYGRYIQYMPWSDKIGFTQCIQIDTNGQNSYPISQHWKMPHNGTSNENAAFSSIFESLEYLLLFHWLGTCIHSAQKPIH